VEIDFLQIDFPSSSSSLLLKSEKSETSSSLLSSSFSQEQEPKATSGMAPSTGMCVQKDSAQVGMGGGAVQKARVSSRLKETTRHERQLADIWRVG